VRTKTQDKTPITLQHSMPRFATKEEAKHLDREATQIIKAMKMT
jgi:hypothetical protein